MNLPLGIWSLNANGRQETLAIRGIDRAGKLDITLNGVSVVGYWDEITRRILFQGPMDHERLQQGQFSKTYVGYLLELNEGKSTEIPTLAGYFDYQRKSETQSQNPGYKKTFGWYAQLVSPVLKMENKRNRSYQNLPHRTASPLV